MKRAIVLIDGEHYPPVVRAALAELSGETQIVGAAFLGGTEKVDAEGPDAYGVALVRGHTAEDALRDAIGRFSADEVVDLSDEPVLSSSDRMRLASLALSLGLAYRGADFEFTPPRARITPNTPTLGIIGTGKRVGKTAISAHLARTLKEDGLDPVVLAMGRGGPAEPELIHGDRVDLTTADLLELARQGQHASSDNYEDAVMSRVTTVGCRRCGGGMAGETFFSNVAQGARLADALGKDVLVLEGSGAAIPPVHADATALVVAASRGVGYVRDYFGPYRLSRADLVIISFAEPPTADAAAVEAVIAAVAAERPGVPVIATTFRPRPLANVAGKRAMFVTTAPAQTVARLAEHLEAQYGCEIVGTSHNLSNRALLREDLARHAGTFDVLLTELKAAAIDVVAAAGEAIGVPTVLCDNVPVAVDGADLEDAIRSLAHLAIRRGRARGEGVE